MNYVVDIINSPNFLKFAMTLLIGTLIVWFFIKSNALTIHSKYVTMGMQDKEHRIMRKQLSYAKQSCAAFERMIPKGDKYDKWKGRCITEYVFDEMVDWIALNHIETTDTYISIKQETVWNIIQAHVDKPEHSTEEFKQVVFESVKKDIQMFVKIRKEAMND